MKKIIIGLMATAAIACTTVAKAEFDCEQIKDKSIREACDNDDFTCEKIKDKVTRKSCISDRVAKEALDKVSSQAKVDEFASEVNIEYDKFRQQTEINGPDIKIFGGPNHSPVGSAYWHYISLRGFKKKVASSFQIYVDTHYYAPRYTQFRNAFDGKGTKLPLTILDHEVVSCDPQPFTLEGDCLFNEVFVLDISKAYIQSRGKLSETEYKIEGVSNELTFRISGEYFRGFLKGLNNNKPTVNLLSE